MVEPCCAVGLSSLGSEHDVAVPCPSADTLKVLGETHPGLGWKLMFELELMPALASWLTPGLTSDGSRVRDVSQMTLWAGEGRTEPEVSAGVGC